MKPWKGLLGATLLVWASTAACAGLTRAKTPPPLPSPSPSPGRDEEGAILLPGASTPVAPTPGPGPWPEAPSTWAGPLGLRPADTAEGSWRRLPSLQAFRATHQVAGEVELSGAYLVDPDGDGLPEGGELVRLYLGLRAPSLLQVALKVPSPGLVVGASQQELPASPFGLAGPFFLRLPPPARQGDGLDLEWTATPAGAQGGGGRLTLPLQAPRAQLQWRRLWWSSSALGLEVELEWQQGGAGLAPAGQVELLGAEPRRWPLPPLGPGQAQRLGPWRFAPNPAAKLLLGQMPLKARVHLEDGAVVELASSLPAEAWRGQL